MSPPELSRREILAGLGGIGVVGAVSGAGTYGLLAADRSFGGSIRTGTLSVGIDCQRCFVEDSSVAFSIGGIRRGDSDTETISLDVETNPARVWIRTDCPPLADPLGRELLVRIRYDDGDGPSVIASGTFSDVRRRLRSGAILGSGCTTPGKAAELDIEWELPPDASDSAAGQTTNFELEFFAEQCRHGDTNGSDDPFAGTSPCEEPTVCVPCPRSDHERIAGASFEYDGPDTATIELIQQQSDNSPQTDYAFGALDPGDTFSTDLPGSGKADIDVLVDGEKIGDFHISCSEPFGPGLVVGDGTYSLTVLDATDKAGDTICEVEQ